VFYFRYSQANNNGVAFAVAPKLETENEGSAASENEEWSDADLAGPATPHQAQPHQTQTHQTQAHQTQAHQVGVTAAAVAAAAVAAQSFASAAPYRIKLFF
jgi:hypothetical protein